MNHQENLQFIVRAKDGYREDSRAKTWEQKVASIELMREAAKKARQSMTISLPSNVLGKDHE